MPVYFRAPLPGPFHYSKRVRLPRVRRAHRRPLSDINGTSAAGILFLVILLIAVTVAAPFVMLPIYAVTAVVVVLVRRRRAAKRLAGATVQEQFEAQQR